MSQINNCDVCKTLDYNILTQQLLSLDQKCLIENTIHSLCHSGYHNVKIIHDNLILPEVITQKNEITIKRIVMINGKSMLEQIWINYNIVNCTEYTPNEDVSKSSSLIIEAEYDP